MLTDYGDYEVIAVRQEGDEIVIKRDDLRAMIKSMYAKDSRIAELKEMLYRARIVISDHVKVLNRDIAEVRQLQVIAKSVAAYVPISWDGNGYECFYCGYGHSEYTNKAPEAEAFMAILDNHSDNCLYATTCKLLNIDPAEAIVDGYRIN